MIPGLKANPAGDADTTIADTTIAVVLPHFDAILNSRRLGTHNIDPDKDGITREYKLWRTTGGWQIPALPLVIGQPLQTSNITLPQNMLINWRGAPFTYHFVSFSDVMTDMSNKVKKRPQDEFKNKIVIIGSTAPSLFDLKATPMAKIHPGVEILATAIDNVKHGDFLHVLRGASIYILMSLLFVWLTTAAFYFNMDRDRFTKIFSTSQIGVLVLSYIGINLTHTYLDFTGPITWAVAYFSVAKIYAMATDLALQRYLAFGVKSGENATRALIMPILIESAEPLNDTTLKKIKRNIELSSKTPNNVEFIHGTQSGIWGLFGDMLVVTWAYSDFQADYHQAAKDDAMQLGTQLPAIINKSGLPNDTQVRYTIQEGLLSADHVLAKQWRSLFAQAVIKLESELPH
jgi:adenylate cyclase